MNASTVRQIVNDAESAGIYDSLIIVDDNNKTYRVKSDTSTCYFDDGKELVYCFCKNDNPIIETSGDSKFIVEICDYDHITSIVAKVATLSNLADVKSVYNFDPEEIKRVVNKVSRTFQATGYQYDKDNNDPIHKVPYIPNLELGVPYEPYTPPVPNTEEDGE